MLFEVLGCRHQDVKRDSHPGDILIKKLSDSTPMDSLRHDNQKINVTIWSHLSPDR
jgi:hypothetical protein